MAICAVASGNALYLWDLNTKQLLRMIQASNSKPIMTVSFLPNSTTLIYSTPYSVSKINLEPVYDANNDTRLNIVPLITRGGSIEKISSVEFSKCPGSQGMLYYGCGAKIWRRHVYTGTLTRELTHTAPALSKMGNITQILAASTSSLLFTRHRESSKILVWSDNKAKCKTLDPGVVGIASCFCLHPDSHHLIVGSEDGGLSRVNIQSGIVRGHYPPLQTKQDKHSSISRAVGKFGKMMSSTPKFLNQNAPKGSPVVGLMVSPLGDYLVSVTRSGYIAKWDVYNGRLMSAQLVSAKGIQRCSKFESNANIVTRVAHSPNGTIMAMVTAYHNIYVVDVSHMGLIRKIGSNLVSSCGVTGLLISYDGRTLYASHMDGSVTIYDVPTNTLIDKLMFTHPVQTMTLDPLKGLLATTHTNSYAIHLWRDKRVYENVLLHSKMTSGDPAYEMDVYSILDNGDDKMFGNEPLGELGGIRPDANDVDDDLANNTLQFEKCITLSSLPASHYKQLFNLELIKLRNKPKEQTVQKPPDAPFFLQSYSQSKNNSTVALVDSVKKGNDEDVAWDAVWSDDEDGNVEGDSKPKTVSKGTSSAGAQEAGIRSDQSQSKVNMKRKRKMVTLARSNLASALKNCSTAKTYAPVTELLKSMGPSGIDVAFRTLCQGRYDSEGLTLLMLACDWLVEALESRSEYEVVQAYLHRFMLVHGDILSGVEQDYAVNGEDGEDSESKKQRLIESLEMNESFADKIGKLKIAQQAAANGLRGKMQNALCLLQHFSKMV